MFADLLLDSAFAKAHRPVSKSDEPAHAIRAAEAACDLGAFTETEALGRKLETRIGAKRVEHRIEPEHRRSKRLARYQSSFLSQLEEADHPGYRQCQPLCI